MSKLNRDQVIEIAGIEAVEAVENKKPEFTGALTNDTEWDGYTEFSAYHQIDDYMQIKAYYYQTNYDVKEFDELDSLDWEVEFYEIIED